MHVVFLFWRLRDFISIDTCPSVPVGLSSQKFSQTYLIYLHGLKVRRPYIVIVYCSIASLLTNFSFLSLSCLCLYETKFLDVLVFDFLLWQSWFLFSFHCHYSEFKSWKHWSIQVHICYNLIWGNMRLLRKYNK